MWKETCIRVAWSSYSLGHVDHILSGFLKLVEALLQTYSCFFSHSIKLYVAYRQGRRNEDALWGLCLCPLKGGHGGRRCPSHKQYHKQFHDLSRSTWNKFIAAIRAHIKFRMVFYNFCYQFWGQHCCWKCKCAFTLNSSKQFWTRYMSKPWASAGESIQGRIQGGN